MFELSNQNIAIWKKENNYFVPSSLDISCPTFNRLVSFAIPNWYPAPQHMKVAPVKCPGCKNLSVFLLTNHHGKTGSLSLDEHLYIDKRGRLG